jgi:amidohydrolase
MTIINDLRGFIADAALAVEPRLIEVRRDLHAHPELAFEETRTAGVIARELVALGLEARTGVGRTGVVATIAGGRPGPTLAIRGDMDALPIEEQTGLAFASRQKGKMHACGHDVHSATLLGVAAILKDLAPSLSGTVKLLFQPAEEVLGGARAMIGDGVLDGVDMALGYHNHPDIPVGRFAYVRGPTYAACDRFDLVIHGISGHAAYPHTTVDPIIAAAHLITGLQSVVSREVSPLHPCVVTVGAVHGGTVHNIIPDSCTLLATVRTLSDPVRAQAEAAIRRFCAGTQTTFRVRCDLDWIVGVPPTMNTDRVLEKAVDAARRQLGDVVDEAEPSMGAEDFAEFASRVPSFVLRIGSGAPGRSDHLHNSGYQPDEACMRWRGRLWNYWRHKRREAVMNRAPICCPGDTQDANSVPGHVLPWQPQKQKSLFASFSSEK